jgi:hypothetical protein
MTIDDSGGPARSGTAMRGATWRRKRAVAGVAGAAVLLGGGAYAVTTQLMDQNGSTVPGDVGALAPVVTATSTTPSAVEPPSASVSATNSAEIAATPSHSPAPRKSLTVDEQIAAARSAAAKDGHPVQRPLTPARGMAAEQAPVAERTERTKTGVLRIVSSRSDLSGRRELLWAADEGKAVGDARCTQNFHFSNGNAAVRPTMLLCWRTSSSRSVAVVQVDRSGKPSAAISVAALDREWARLG